MLFFIILIFVIPTVILLAYNFYSHVYVTINDFIFGTSCQANQALKLFNDAGYFGKGIGEGSLKNNLPDAHTDFIFSVIAEEFGIIIYLILNYNGKNYRIWHWGKIKNAYWSKHFSERS